MSLLFHSWMCQNSTTAFEQLSLFMFETRGQFENLCFCALTAYWQHPSWCFGLNSIIISPRVLIINLNDIWTLLSMQISPHYTIFHLALIYIMKAVVTSLTSESWRKLRRWRSWRCRYQPSLNWTLENCWGSSPLSLWETKRLSPHSERSPADLWRNKNRMSKSRLKTLLLRLAQCAQRCLLRHTQHYETKQNTLSLNAGFVSLFKRCKWWFICDFKEGVIRSVPAYL